MSGEKQSSTTPLQPISLVRELVDLPSSAIDANSYDPFNIEHLTQVQKTRDVPNLLRNYAAGKLLGDHKVSTVIAHIGKMPNGVLNLTPDETADFMKATSGAYKAIDSTKGSMMGQATFEALSDYIFETAEYHAQNGHNAQMQEAAQSLHDGIAQLKPKNLEAFTTLGAKINKLNAHCAVQKEKLSDLVHFVSSKSSTRSVTPPTPRTRSSSPGNLMD